MSRLGVIGDVHCEDETLARVLDFFAREKLDRILCVGDIADGRGSLDRCCALLQQHGVTTVAGNHERWLLAGHMRMLPEATAMQEVSEETRDYLASLPKTVELDTEVGRLLLCHGLGGDDMAEVRPGDYGYALEVNDALQHLIREGRHRLVVNGHTHERMLRRFGQLVLINAGTIKHDHEPSCVIIDAGRGEVSFYDVAKGVSKAATFPLQRPSPSP